MRDIFNNFFLGSGDSQKRLEQHRQRLYRIAYAWTHQPALADDLAQETLTKAMQRIGQLRDPNAGEAWLYSILTNCYRDHFRRTRDTDDIDEHDLPHEDTPERLSGQTQVVSSVRAAIARLPEGQRQVVTLVDLEGFSYVEVAQILEVPIGTVMSRLCRARAALKELLAFLRDKEELTQSGEARAATRIRRIK